MRRQRKTRRSNVSKDLCHPSSFSSLSRNYAQCCLYHLSSYLDWVIDQAALVLHFSFLQIFPDALAVIGNTGYNWSTFLYNAQSFYIKDLRMNHPEAHRLLLFCGSTMKCEKWSGDKISKYSWFTR